DPNFIPPSEDVQQNLSDPESDDKHEEVKLMVKRITQLRILGQGFGRELTRSTPSPSSSLGGINKQF
ncbi:hypothetical protein HHI36_007739, partial [Cryptolaemus montrouzieri]